MTLKAVEASSGDPRATESGPQWRAWRSQITLALCFAAALAEGYDVQSMGVAAPHMAPALGLSRDQLGSVFSASTIGLFLGAALIGRLADQVGRKWTLIGSLAIYGVFSGATAAAHGLYGLLAIRWLAGLGLGGAMPNLMALAAETVDLRRRSLTVTLVASGFPFGSALAAAAAAGLDWRSLFYVGGIAPLILAVLMTGLLSESAVFLQARASPANGEPARIAYASVLFGPGRGVTTLILWTGTFCSLLTLYLLLNWLPTLMGLKGVSKLDASLVSVLFNLGGGLGVWMVALLLERGRRAWILAVWYVGLAFALVALARVGLGLAAVGTAGFFAGVFVSSAPIVLYGMAPNYYTVSVRGTGVGVYVAVGRLGSIAGPLLAAALLAAGVGASGVLTGLLPLAMLAGAASLGLLTRPTVGV
jgi:AAHS family 3-hydroxyphenylpropionic acid transporter